MAKENETNTSIWIFSIIPNTFVLKVFFRYPHYSLFFFAEPWIPFLLFLFLRLRPLIWRHQAKKSNQRKETGVALFPICLVSPQREIFEKGEEKKEIRESVGGGGREMNFPLRNRIPPPSVWLLIFLLFLLTPCGDFSICMEGKKECLIKLNGNQYRAPVKTVSKT